MTQNTKNILLLIGFLFLLFLSYKLGISKTIDIKREVNQLEIQSWNLANTNRNLMLLKSRENIADSILQKNNLKNTSVQNNLLSVLTTTSQSSNFKVTTFNEPHTFSNENVQRTSYQFSLTGDFNDILDLVYSLEQQYSFGNVSYLNFEKKKDFKKRRDYLQVDVVLENFVSE